MNYQTFFQQSVQYPEAFWTEQARLVAWHQFPSNILSQNEKGYYRWYADGMLNTSYLAIDYHVENGRAEQTALIYDSPVTNTIRSYTYRQLQQEVARLAGALLQMGVRKGDTVIIYMPMIPEAAFAMLACARIGAIHSVVFGGFAAHELAIRINDAHPRLIITASCGVEIDRVIPYKPLVDKAIQEATHKPKHVLLFQREMHHAELIPERDIEWHTALENAQPADCVPVAAGDPLYILYTSGTTGKPKGIVRDNGGHAVAMRFSMKYVYGAQDGDVFWASSDIGWVVGHSYIIYAPLINGLTTIMFEGKPVRTPDAGTFWRVIEQHKVNIFFSAPTAFRAIKKEDPEAKLKTRYDLSCLRTVFVAGERCDVPTYEWIKETLQVPVIDHWWQTESGWPMLANMMGVEYLPPRAGSAGKPVCGYNIMVLNEAGQPAAPNEEGPVVIKLPLAPGTLPTLWNDDFRFEMGYLRAYPGYYLSGDGGYVDQDGYVFITGRIDDIINVAGHRLSTVEMEEVVAAHPGVVECAVIGMADELKGQIPVGLVVLKDGFHPDPAELEKELIRMVRDQIGPVASFKHALIVKRLPKTRSGKILRKTMRKIADGEQVEIPSTIDDPTILDEIREVFLHNKVV